MEVRKTKGMEEKGRGRKKLLIFLSSWILVSAQRIPVIIVLPSSSICLNVLVYSLFTSVMYMCLPFLKSGNKVGTATWVCGGPVAPGTNGQVSQYW